MPSGMVSMVDHARGRSTRTRTPSGAPARRSRGGQLTPDLSRTEWLLSASFRTFRRSGQPPESRRSVRDGRQGQGGYDTAKTVAIWCPEPDGYQHDRHSCDRLAAMRRVRRDDAEKRRHHGMRSSDDQRRPGSRDCHSRHHHRQSRRSDGGSTTRYATSPSSWTGWRASRSGHPYAESAQVRPLSLKNHSWAAGCLKRPVSRILCYCLLPGVAWPQAAAPTTKLRPSGKVVIAGSYGEPAAVCWVTAAPQHLFRRVVRSAQLREAFRRKTAM